MSCIFSMITRVLLLALPEFTGLLLELAFPDDLVIPDKKDTVGDDQDEKEGSGGEGEPDPVIGKIARGPLDHKPPVRDEDCRNDNRKETMRSGPGPMPATSTFSGGLQDSSGTPYQA